MQIKKFKFNNDEIVQIYISQNEKDNDETIEKINKIIDKNSNVFIFISGENSTVKTIQEMLNYEKSKNYIQKG